jgi:putative DNA primase/helicase
MTAALDFRALMEPVTLSLLGEPNRELSRGPEWRYGSNGSMLVDVDKGTWFDFESNIGGGVFDLIRREVPGADPVRWLDEQGYIDPAPRGNGGSAPTETVYYEYRDEQGASLFRVVRVQNPNTEKKTRPPWQQRPDGRGGWINGTKGDKARPLPPP